MPKIIFTSRYLRDAPPAQLENYVRYIGTREGAEKIDQSRRMLPATAHQRQLIRQLLRDIPASKAMLEYTDFLLQPTIGNASEFIQCTLEQNLDLVAKRENYVDYIAGRPRVERIGGHGLFTDAGQPVVLAQVQQQAMQHKGPIWTHVISLRREDAARLGYDSAAQWMALLRSKRAMLCRYMKISSENLRWYAAFHNEGHHPHVHLMVYAAKESEGFLTEKSIAAMRSELAHDIFRQDFAHIYEAQNHARAALKTSAADVLRELMDTLRTGTMVNAQIEKQMLRLSERLQHTKGKKVYGYLKRDVKNLIDQIVDELAQDSRVQALYQAWARWNGEVLLTYQDTVPPLAPLSAQPQFKSIKNMVIREAMLLGSHHFTFEDEQTAEPPEPIYAASMPKPELPEDTPEPPEDTPELFFHATWSKPYKQAKQYLFGGAGEQDFDKAFRLFLQQAQSGNALAMYDLGRMCADGLGCEADLAAAQDWYAKAFAAFQAAAQTAAEKQKPYLWYRIGKMLAAGLGTPQDYAAAAQWFSQAVDANHKYAQYSLAGLYHRGQGVQQDYAQAFHLYACSAKQKNPYASYEMAKMYRDGIGTEQDNQAAAAHFQNAFSGFLHLEQQSHDDKLQYRLGQMLHTGIGTARDDAAAVVYWQRAARLGNVNAQYALGKLWLQSETGDPAQAVAWIAKAADGGNAAAQYALGKLYRDGQCVEQNAGKAAEWFTKAAEQHSEFAAYALGKLYLTGEDVPKDVETAIAWLSRAAEQANPFAQYALGKLYLTGEDVPKDVEAAIAWLSRAAEQANPFAQYALGKLYLCGREVPRDKAKAQQLLQASAAQGNPYAQLLLEHWDTFRDPSAFLAATRLLHRLESLFRQDYRSTSGGEPLHIDRKRRRRLSEKKQAQGHRPNNHPPIRQHTF